MTETLFTYNPTLMSPRTKKYFEAMIREGNSFNYRRWLEKVREEEAEAKPEAKGTSGEEAAGKIDNPLSAPEDRYAKPSRASRLLPKTIRIPGAFHRPHRQAKSKNPKTRLRQWLETVHRAWGEFQASRKRDAVYGYLEAVFGIVMDYKVRRRTNRLLRHAFDFADLPFDKNADPFGAVIRCTSGRNIDTKTISKWSRALRYVASSKKPETAFKTFMKEAGGINACADRCASMLGSRGR
jgi:hypothetical protein